MNEHTRYRLRAALWVVSALALLAPQAQAELIFLDEAEIFIEINDTDGDAGIQVFVDGEDWERMGLVGPGRSLLFKIEAKGSVAAQGLTELFFESAEPSFDEQTLDELLALFPEGEYVFLGRTTEGDRLVGVAELTHNLPDAPVQIYPVDGEEVDPDALVLDWLPAADPPGSEIVRYEVVVETDEDPLMVFKADIAPDTTSLSVPPEFLQPGTAYKWEVLAVEESHNQTISEAEFETAED